MVAAAQFRGRPGPGRRLRSRIPRKSTLTWLALALLTVGSVGDLGSAPTAAVFGLASVALYVIPAVLAYVASTLSYVFAPGLAHGGLYTTVVIVVLFWAVVLITARGALAADKLAS